MPKLNKDWITESHIDFEYKKYLLLAYLQDVERHFELTRLYPSLSELADHYLNAKSIKEHRHSMFSQFPQRLAGLDPENFRLKYEKVIRDDELMKEIESIVDFSIPMLKQSIEEGKKIYDFVDKHMHISPVGLVPLDIRYGYLFLRHPDDGRTEAYTYQVTLFEHADEKYRALHTRHAGQFQYSITTTYNSMKTELIRANSALPNPAVFAIESEIEVPHEETYLPLAKRMLVKYISRQSKPVK